MSFALAIACGVAGSITGALANYGLAHWLGRAVVRRIGKYFWISERSLERSERYFAAHGEISTFMGRMLPVIRHLISIPAGIARMNLAKFVTFTGLGALVRCTVLTWIGWFIGRKEDVILTVLNQEAQTYAGRGVRNLPDGSVEVVAQGVEEVLERLERALTRGPSGARVDRVEKTEVPHDMNLSNEFEIN